MEESLFVLRSFPCTAVFVPYADDLVSTYRSHKCFALILFFSSDPSSLWIRNDKVSLVFIYSTDPLLQLYACAWKAQPIHQGYLFLAFKGYGREAGIQSQHLKEKAC